MKIIKLTLLLLILTISPSYAQHLVPVEKENKEQKPVLSEQDKYVFTLADLSTVQVFGTGNGTNICTGVILDEYQGRTYVLTAKHCLSNAKEFYVGDTKVLYSIASATDDLAYLVVKGLIKHKAPAILATTQLKNKDILYHVGYPGIGRTKFPSKGYVVRTSDSKQLTTTLVKPGCSGGGVFNTKGELVGIAVGMYMKDQISIIEPLSDVIKFLDTINNGE